MLKLHHNHHLSLPRALRPPHRLMLSPVTNDDDELLRSAQSERTDDSIVLDDGADAGQLDEFWAGVEADLKKDPTWFDFAND